MPECGSVERHILLWLLIVCLGLVTGCGTRKVNSSKTTVESKDQTEQSSSSEKVSSATDNIHSESGQINDKQNDVTETSTTTKYGPDGKPTESTTTTKTDKSIDRTKYFNKLVRSTVLHEVEKLKTKIITIKQTKFVDKKKDTVADKTLVANVGGPWVLFGLVIVIVGAIWLYFYLKAK